MMNFVADEGIDWAIVKLLRQKGHQVSYIAEMSPGLSDTDVLNLANQEQAILLTFDKDFGEMVFRQKLVALGVILLRLHGFVPEQKAAIILNLIHEHGPELTNAFTVVTSTKVRIRPQS